MSGSIEELIVRAKPEGIDDVTEKFGQMKTSLAENKEEMMDTADSFGAIQERFQGALGAIVSGLAVAAGGLATQVPILGELMGGLSSIVEALAFQIDQVLRPVLTPLSRFFFQVSESIFNADGAVGDLVGGITTLVGVASILITAIAKAGAVAGTFGSTFAGVSSILGTIASVIGTVAAAILSLPAAFLVAIAAIVGFVLAYQQNWFGVRDITNNVLSDIQQSVISAFNSIKQGVTNTLSNLADSAVEFGRSLIRKLIQGIKAAIPELESTLQGLPGGNILLEGADVLEGGANNLINETTNFVRGQTGGLNLSIDGRRLDEQTGRYSFDRAARR